MYKWLKNSGLSFLYISIFILYLSYASIFVKNDIFTSLVFLFLLIIFVIKGHKLDPILYYVLFVWITINIVSAYFINASQEFSFITLTGVTLRIIMPYLIIKLIGIKFFEKLVQYVYVLSIIGLVLFSVQIIYPDLFYSLSTKLNFMTQEEQTDVGGWYVFVYMFSGWASDRNCGFAWEPGAYSCILIFILCYQLVRNKFKLDRYSIIFIISLISTFSTSGFIALFLISISFFLYRKKILVIPVYMLGMIGLIAFSFNFYLTSSFMKEKIDRNIEEQNLEIESLSGYGRINRLEEFNRGLEQSFHWPLGNGILDSDYRIQKHGNDKGSNSLSVILTQWGWVGILFLIYTTAGIYNFYLKNIYVSLLLACAFCIVLYSNPFVMRYLVFAVFFYFYLYINSSQKRLMLEES